MKTFFISSLALFASILFYSCGNEDVFSETLQTNEISEFDANSEEVVNSEVALKEQLVDALPKIMTLIESPTTRGAESNVNEEQIKQELAALSTPIVNMLKSHGFTDKDWEEFEGTDDPAFIFSGIVFLGMLETNANSISVVKTRSESEDCFDPYKVLDCVLQASGVKVAMEAFFGTCITKAIAYGLCKEALKKVAGPIAVAIALGDFAHCMGWLDFSF